MNRRERVLKLIVEHFIKTAEPVGSRTLIENYNFNYSGATIRAEMNSLEQEGFLEKTHTSSGRVPSSKGYRYYIEHLRERSVSDEFKYQMQSILDEKIRSIDDVIKQSCEILSQMTSLASIVLGPNATQEKLISVQLVPISKNSATCVFITDQGYVENKTFVLDDTTSLSDVESCVKLLNKRQKVHSQEKQLEETLANYERELESINREKREVMAKAKEEARSLLQESNAKIEKTIRDIKEAQAEKEKTRAARQELKDFGENLQQNTEEQDRIERKIEKIYFFLFCGIVNLTPFG